VRDGLRLLQDAAERKKTFMKMIREVEADVEKNGTVSIDEAMAEVDRIIEEAERTRKAAS
jgi:antitoxin ParD1/3/4